MYWITYNRFFSDSLFWSIVYSNKRPKGRNVLGPYDTKNEAERNIIDLAEQIFSEENSD